jgi:EAL domain-containing protein (putative c-di-GMP-specific phosphodiesterase class I)
VVRRADLAMYHVKESRLADAREYDIAMDDELAAFRTLEAALKLALPRNEFSVVYQPILQLRTGAIDHVEALLRFDSRDLGSVPPDRFIPVAEKTGLIQEIGLHVLESVCQDMARWPGVTVSVNISPVQLLNANFVRLASEIVARHGISPSSIIFELTEGVLIDSPHNARIQLDALKAAGFSIFLDDFGSGFSSIGYLSQFPFDGVKIDKSLVQGVDASQSKTVLDSIIAMAGAMKLEVVAEGVETEEQRERLTKSDCGWMQGYLISRPLPVSAVSPFLAESQLGALRQTHARMAVSDGAAMQDRTDSDRQTAA